MKTLGFTFRKTNRRSQEWYSIYYHWPGLDFCPNKM